MYANHNNPQHGAAAANHNNGGSYPGGHQNDQQYQHDPHYQQQDQHYQNNQNDHQGQQYQQDHHNQPVTIQLYTHNIRNDGKNPTANERPWSIRKQHVIGCINYCASYLPTLVGLQEVKKNQLDDIQAGLGPEWKYFGIGRDDGINKGEFAPVFYKDSEWEFLSGRTYWLSETPDVPSKGWDAALPRIVTVVTLRHRQSGTVVTFMNTHYDHRGKLARENSSKQILHLMLATKWASFLVGDFNSEPNHEAYKTLANGGLVDAGTIAVEKGGFQYTCSGFTKGGKESSIDFIWVQHGVHVMRHEVMNHEFDGYFFSDHRPVTAIVQV
ncbi:Endonuclease/exonuclease/phosphatase [Scheffersomyces xylosifermentans]|uniref:Endonuclease/exonuclease/phosphatase n=1 Tax=Scheffersomyces xylosifermentans TaxID=1304137 RepID=UPI00315CA98A